MAPISKVAASLMRKPQAYMRARQALWTGILTPPSNARTCSSDRTAGSRVVWAGEFFFLKQRPVAIQRPAIEELDAALIGPERAERDPALTQTEQIAPYLFLAQLIRRTAVVRGQPTDRVDVDGLRRRPPTPPTSCLRSSAVATASSRSPLVRASRRDGASSKENSLNSNAAREAPPYGGAVQSCAGHVR